MLELLSTIYKEVLFRPLSGALVFLANILPGRDFGIAIIFLTIILKLILHPLSRSALIAQKKMRELEPEIKKIREVYKKDSHQVSLKTMELYRANGVKPWTGILNLAIQLPILIALYQVFYNGAFLPADINKIFLGLIDLNSRSLVLAFLAAASQFLLANLTMVTPPKSSEGAREEFSRALAIQMKYIFPIIIFYLATKFPAALPLYWTASNIFATFEEILVSKKYGRRKGKNRENNYGASGKNGVGS